MYYLFVKSKTKQMNKHDKIKIVIESENKQVVIRGEWSGG